ncbi:MAG: hypothetical protein AAFX05_04115 [Planctomycetota bacterium]
MIEYVVIIGYLLFLVAIGVVFRRFNSNVSDYFRVGCKGTWWLVGASTFMSVFSAWTFTGAAGSAYESGWSILVIFFANVLAFTVHAIWLAPWFRQLRSVTAPEMIRLRFGASTQQVYAWMYAVLGLLYASVWLWSLSVFIATVFDWTALAESLNLTEVQLVIAFIGTVVLIYSVSGGSWAVMATDVLQSLVLVPLTLLVAFLCLMEVGGISGLFQGIREAGLAEDFAIVNEPGSLVDDPTASDFWKYTWLFCIATLIYKVVTFSTIDVAQKYFGVKDGREARFAALLAGGLMLGGMAFWFIPPIVSRLLWPEQVMAMEMSKPEESAYAVAGMNVLPMGLIGLMIVAMLSATMSSMDSGLNKNAAVFTRDIYPAIARLFGRREPGETLSFILGQVTSFVLGIIIIGLALLQSSASSSSTANRGVFEAMLDIGALVSLPMAIPLALALFVRHAPWWAAVFAVLAAMVPSGTALLASTGALADFAARLPEQIAPWFEYRWPYHRKVFVILGTGITAFCVTIPFWRFASSSYRANVEEFFTRMHTPIDFQKEIGDDNDAAQMKVIGTFATTLGAGICLLLLVPGNGLGGRLAIVFVGGFVALAGSLLWLAGRSKDRKARAAAESTAT